MESDEIKEGFLCPICLKDMRSASLLQKHFEDVHSDDKDTLRQIRGMFGKAKRKIMDKIDNTDGEVVNNLTPDGIPEGSGNRGVDPFLWDHQEFGKDSGIINNINTAVRFFDCQTFSGLIVIWNILGKKWIFCFVLILRSFKKQI